MSLRHRSSTHYRTHLRVHTKHIHPHLRTHIRSNSHARIHKRASVSDSTTPRTRLPTPAVRSLIANPVCAKHIYVMSELVHFIATNSSLSLSLALLPRKGVSVPVQFSCTHATTDSIHTAHVQWWEIVFSTFRSHNLPSSRKRAGLV